MTELATAFVRLRPVAGAQFQAEARREVQSGLRNVLQIGAGVTGGVIAVDLFRDLGRAIKGAAAAAAEEEVRADLLSQAIDNAGASHQAFGRDIEVLIDKESRLKGFTDQELSSAFARLVQATGDTELSMKDLGLAEDVARIRKIELGQAAIALAKAEQGSTTALSRLGIIIPKVHTEVAALTRRHDEAVAAGAKFSKAQDLIYKSALTEAAGHDKVADRLKARQTVQDRFGGSALKFAGTTSGQFSRLRVAVNEFEESLGKDLLPPLARGAEGLTHLTEQAQNSEDVISAVHESGKLLGGTLTFIGDTARTVGPPLLDIAKAGEAVASAIGAPALLTGLATFKGLHVALAAGTTIQAAYTRAVEGGASAVRTRAVSEAAAQASVTRSTAEYTGLTTAISANTVALERNVAASRLTTGAFSTVQFGSRAAKTEVAALGAATRDAEVVATTASRGGFAALSRGIGTLALGAVGGPVGLAIIGLAGVAGGIAYAATRTGDFDRAAGNLRTTLGLLNSSLNRTKELSLGLAQSKVDVELAKDSKAAADAAVQQAEANERATRGTKQHSAAVLALKTARDQDAAAALAVKRAEQSVGAAQTAARQNQADIAATRARAVEQANAVARATRANDIPQPTIRFGDSTVFQRERQERAAAAADKFAAALDREAAANQKNAPHLAASVRLLGQYAEAVGRVPTKKEIAFILNPSNARLSLRQIERELGTAAVTLGVNARRHGHEVGVALSEGVASGIAESQLKVSAGMARQVTGAVAAGKAAAEARSPSARTAREIGLPLAQGIAVGIDTGAADVQRSLRDTVGEAIRQGGQQVADAVNQAKQNLNSIGAGLASAASDVLSAPLQRAQARFTAQQNRLALDNLKRSVVLPGGHTLSGNDAAAERQLQQLAGRPGTNQGALQGLLLQFQQARLAVRQDLVTAQSTALTRGIGDTTDLFNKGSITAREANRRIAALLAKDHISYRRAGNELGVAFADGFQAQLVGLREQIRAEVGAPKLPGSGLVPSIVRPLDTLREVTVSIAQAQRERDQAAQAERKAQTVEAKKHTKALEKIAGQQAAAAFIASLPKGQQAAVSAALTGTGR